LKLFERRRDAQGGNQTAGPDFRCHDLRGECASRLVEANVRLSQVRDILCHASIVTTERYDRQKFDTLRIAARKLDTGKSFQIPSRSELVVLPESAVNGEVARQNTLTIQ